MKNIHVLSTYKPSRLHRYNFEGFALSKESLNWKEAKHIYITSSDEEITGFENNIWVIKGDRIFLWQNTMALVSNNKPKKIILTTDQDLIKDGVQTIDDEFLEWFVKNPSCESVEIGIEIWNDGTFSYRIIIPNEEPKQDYSIITEQTFTKKDLEEAYKTGWRADKTYQSGKESFKQWFKNRFTRKPVLFKVKRDLSFYKQNNYEEE
jgi:hypothetical protein